MEKIDLKNFNPRNGWVAILPLREGVSASVETSMGTFDLDPDIDNHKNMGVTGVIVSVCNKLEGMEWIPNGINIEKGDLVWYNWHTIGSAYDDEGKVGIHGNRLFQSIDDEKVIVILVPYYQLFCKVKKENVDTWLDGTTKGLDYVEMLNGYCLIEPELSRLNVDTIFDLSATESISQRIGYVRKVGENNLSYTALEVNEMPFYPEDEMVDIKEADRVLIDKNCNLPLEWDYQGTRPESIGGTYFRVQKRYISMVLDKDTKISETTPVLKELRKEIVTEDALMWNIQQERNKVKEQKTKLFI